MRLDELDYHLPDELIAQGPARERGASRLLVRARDGSRETVHTTFDHLPEFLRAGDVLVLNRTRVVPARLLARRDDGLDVEVLFIREAGDGRFAGWVRPLKKLKPGDELRLSDTAAIRFVGRGEEREGIFEVLDAGVRVLDLLDAHGHVPLPPYIRRGDEGADRDRYQTVYAKEPGSVAAPTAGLHFNDLMLRRVLDMGVDVQTLVLHVGPGTFQPLDHDVLEENRLHAEPFTIDASTLASIAAARSEKRRVIAVGTTVARTLETIAARGWIAEPAVDRSGETDLFVYPGYSFQVVDALLTNFHLPKSSLLALVCAFAGTRPTLALYQDAVARGYRFFSYGDAMFIA
ncbi:MAG: tRNA preQ1(34) S-adenosylmethionine ribosyltransferase-isomerase QueA [Candidatus Krumholzibacteria bacterium]|nr:tRNA preQ1(34) S-adenosylmethionine ribosyltransferase-isomerase QueA [Candidatus Krumholzibacteria bacterium]MDH4335926.1 tRNA preQ1(34) S-adenosylmethionine ribosyltransferase-isomerase QueA [Candidatus Krumholzibacteria bacterium]MDH5268498.1 tRNA preQ1(34) S-adenosylmethionine ribosyltransferase-isomerase QueA [Candidatus Krumholzibacteria bacterium]